MNLRIFAIAVCAFALTGCFYGQPARTTTPTPSTPVYTVPTESSPDVQPYTQPAAPPPQPPVAVRPAIPQNPDILEAQQALLRAEQNPTVATQLPLDLERARASLNEAEAIWKREKGTLKPDSEEWLHIQHLSYIAKQRAAIAEAKARSINALRGQPGGSRLPERQSSLTVPVPAPLAYAPPAYPAPSRSIPSAPAPSKPAAASNASSDFQSTPVVERSPVEVVNIFDTPLPPVRDSPKSRRQERKLTVAAAPPAPYIPPSAPTSSPSISTAIPVSPPPIQAPAVRQPLVQQPPVATTVPGDLPVSLRSLNPRRDSRGVVLTFDDKHFMLNGTLMLPNNNQLLDSLVEYLTRHPGQPVVCEGYSDMSPYGGSPQAFAEGRARSVQEGLFERGVQFKRVRIVGYGYSQGSANRSVDVVIKTGPASPST